MKKSLYALYDVVSSTYSYPFPAVNDTQALRIIEAQSLGDNADLNKFPDDFTLYCVGVYDENTAELIPKKDLVRLVNVRDYLTKRRYEREAEKSRSLEINSINEANKK